MSTQPRVVWAPTFNRILCILAVVCFLVAAFGVHFPGVDAVDLGLALFAGSFVV